MLFKRICSNLKNQIINSFPIIDYLSLDPVALEINSDSIRVLKLKKKKNKLVPVFFEEVSIEIKNQDSENSGNIFELPEYQNQVIEKLKELKNKYNFKYAIVALPEDKTYLYQTTFPRAALSDMGSAIKYSLEENVPVAATDVNFNYHILNKDKNLVDVVVSVFPKSIISQFTNILEASQIKIYSFLPESVAVFKSLIGENDQNLYLLIRLLKDRVNISIVKDQAIQYTFAFSVDLEKIMKNQDFDGQEFKKLSQELNKSMIYWFTSKKDINENQKIQKALIAGDYASDVKLIEALEDSLKIDVETGDVWTNCFSTEDYVPEISRKEALKYNVAIGLAIRTFD
jgi:Tfp pilus assembly PilM family ATPase